MFGFGKSAKLDRVMALLNERMPLPGQKAEKIFSRSDIEWLFNIADDVNTTAEMMLLSYQADFIQRLVDQSPFEGIALELIDIARNDASDATAMVTREADAYYLAAKDHCVEVERMITNGDIVGTPQVRKFCADKATALLSSSALYSARLRLAYERLTGHNPSES